MEATTVTEALSPGGAARSALEGACGEVTQAGAGDAVDGVAPAVVVRPASTAEVSETLRAAATHGLAVVPRGRGTTITWGRPPNRADVLLDLSRLDQVLDHAAGDLVVQTQAGARLGDVQRVVGQARQRLAVDETVPGASIGGTLAAARSGPLRTGFGTVRDLLIGVTVVRADGVVAKAGGRVVKNVAGYDLGKLVIGSFGTLAVITEAVFRLHPAPVARRHVSVPVSSAQEAHTAAHAMVHSQVVPSAVELDWAQGRGTLGVLLEGVPQGVEGRAATAARLLGAGAAVAEDPPAGWGTYPWPLDAGGEADREARRVAVKLTFALSGLGDVVSAAAAAEVPLHLRGSAGAGVLYAAAPGDTEPAALSRTVDQLRGVCARHGGALVVLDAPRALKESLDTWGPVPALDLMRRVKDQFDPDHRLSPGRFVGGI